MASLQPRRGAIGALRGLLTLAEISMLVMFAAGAPARAQGRHAAMIIDANSGEVLHAEKADEPRYPASLTKMMTLYMVFEQLEAGRLRADTKLKVSQEAASAQPTKLDLEPGEQIAVMDAIKALVTKSANDMAIALAEAIGGTEANFATLMTQKARAIGMRSTTFRNASGLPDPGQLTTARDMLTLALHLQDDFPKYFPLFALRAFSYNGSTYRNHNTMLNSFDGIDGIKTGYTRMSGFNLVTSLHRGDKHLVGAVFGGTTAGTRNLTMRMLLTRGLMKASTKKTRKAAPVLVARARPATRLATTTAVATAMPPVKATAAPAAKAVPRIAAVPAPVGPPRPVVVAEATPAPAAPATAAVPEPALAVEIARVRPVMVAPRVKRNVFLIRPGQDEAPGSTEVPSTAVTVAAAALESHELGSRAAAALAETVEPPLPPAPRSVPVPAAGAVPPPARSAVVPAAMTTSAPPPLRGTLPSTLQAQADSLSQPVAPAVAPMPVRQQVAFAGTAPSRLRGPDPASLPQGGFHIQIGAYASSIEAERVLKETQARSNGVLAAATPMTTPVEKGNRLLYRARFAGFDAKRAADTCLELRRAAIDCFVMKAE